jgi:hypothetical protein
MEHVSGREHLARAVKPVVCIALESVNDSGKLRDRDLLTARSFTACESHTNNGDTGFVNTNLNGFACNVKGRSIDRGGKKLVRHYYTKMIQTLFRY